MSQECFIVGAARTPIGGFLGVLSDVPAPVLGSVAIREALTRAKVAGDSVEEVLMGCVLSAGQGQAPARQAMLGAGIPVSTGAVTINKVCGSGLKAVMLADTAIRAGGNDLLIAGGMESMSQVPYYLAKARKGFRMGHQKALDGMIHDGLWDPYHDFHMGNAGELCAREYGFSRENQDAFARTSYERAMAAVQSGAFRQEIAPVEIPQRKGSPEVVAQDEQPFLGGPDKLAELRPAFDKEGTITAGNASTINDGAAAVVVASAQAVKKYALKPMARIVATATHSQEPEWFTTAPVGAIKKALDKAGLGADDMDLYEINEAFSVVAMVCMQQLGLDHAKVNVRGGAVALGHPIGASGCRLLVTLLHALADLKRKRGLVTLCVGGGEAVAMIVERV